MLMERLAAGILAVLVVAGQTPGVTFAVPIHDTPAGVGVNPATNRIYVANFRRDGVSVIDGAQDRVVASVPVGRNPWGVGINATTNRIYGVAPVSWRDFR